MASLHCNRCEQDWPVDYDDFGCCPECSGRTWWTCAGKPLGREKALSRKRHADFERYFERRELARFSEQAELRKGLEFEPSDA